ncbi:MAG: TonB-dependent receptor [Acidobacteria bacterium]|nr:TonB-dependent receptor [Acidobacteriota bacterium]
MKTRFSQRSTGVLALALICVAALWAPPAWTQILYGSVVGNIKDPSDAAIAGAHVAITDKQTAQSRETKTNDSGGFTVPTLTPGTYVVRVQKEGFRTTTTEVVVSINTLTRADLTLQIGAVAEAVEVTATSSVLQTDRSEVRSEVSSRTFQNLPVPVGRNYQNLMRVLPGFRPPANAHSVPTNPSRALTYNVNGVSQSINNVRIDGASSNSPWLPHITSFVPTLEAIDTVNVVTSNFDAEQGLAGGAAVNVQIRSGTNALHGSVFEYHTNNKLKAKPWILPAGTRMPKLVNNEFGGTLGGPIKHDKAFFFVSYEGTPNREFASRLGTVPTPLQKAGNFSESLTDVFDPATGSPDGSGRLAFPGKIIPASRFSAITKKLVDLTPNPNVATTAFTNNYFAGGSYIFDRHRVDSKVNWNPTSKLSMFGRYSLLNYSMENLQMFGSLGGPEVSSAGGNPGSAFGRTHSFTGAVTYILTPNLIVDAYYGFTLANTTVEQARLDEKLGTDFLGIPGTNGTRRFEGGWPAFVFGSGYTTLGMPNAFMPYDRSDPQHQYVANLNYTKGKHEVRFGVDVYFTGMNHLQPEATGASHGAAGGFTFGGGPTQLSGGAAGNQFNSYATFLLGLATNVGKITQVPDIYRTRQKNFATYVRDRWNVNRKLTLSYGLRWEYYPFPTRTDRGMEWYNPETNKMYLCGVGQVPDGCGVNLSKTNFAPRAGFAYRVSDSFVIRSGYGITYDPFSLQRPLRTNYPVLLIQNIPSPNSFSWVSRIEEGIPKAVIPEQGNGIIDVPGTYAVITTPKDFKRGYIQSWNFTMQKQLKWGFTGQAGYVATRSVRQLGYLNINAGQTIGTENNGRPLFQRFGRLTDTIMATGMGTTTYDSLQMQLERRFARGSSMAVAYTWGKGIGFNNNSDEGPRGTHSLLYFDRNRALLSYDRTHNLQISNMLEAPFGKGHRWASEGVAAKLLGGWQINNLLSFYSGTPFSIGADGNSLRMPGSSQTADQVKQDVAYPRGTGRGTPWFDPDAFANLSTARGQERFGNTGFNILRGPGLVNWDFGLFRHFQITERFRLSFRMESFNFTNTPHFANPGSGVQNYQPTQTDPLRRYNGYGEITGVQNIGRDGIDERQFRFGLRLGW